LSELSLQNGLPFVVVNLQHNGKRIQLSKVLLDTGSAATLLNIDHALELGLDCLPSDPLRRICGVGGAEFVFEKRVAYIALGQMKCMDFAIQIGDMDYGFQLDGIIGMDFLTQVGAQLDLANLKIFNTTRHDAI